MNNERFHPGVIDHEPRDIVSYEEYRELCDNSRPDIYRKTGVTTPEAYQAAKSNDETIYIEMEGRLLPLFVSLEDIGGYDIERTKQLTGAQNLVGLTLPTELIEAAGADIHDYLELLDENTAVIVETASSETQQVKDALVSEDWKDHDFLDVRCPEGEQMARISIYTSHFEARDNDGNLLPRRDLSWKQLFQEELRETGDYDTLLIEASEIREDDKSFEELWELHDEKFDWLGMYHPVSMQEDVDFYGSIVTDDRTSSIVRFDEDENNDMTSAGHGIFTDDINQITWVNDKFLQKLEEETKARGEDIVFFYGIASKSTPDKALHYAKDIMSLNTRLAQRRGGKICLVFESTTLSSQYIPRLVEEYSREEPKGMTMTESVKPVSQVDYWALVPSRSEIV